MCKFVGPQILALAIVGWQASSGVVLTAFYACLVLNLCVALWLLVFNSGQAKLAAFSLAITPTEIVLSTFGKIRKIEVPTYNGYAISGLFLKKVIISDAQGKTLTFSYFALNKRQRYELFTALDVHCTQ